MGIRLGQSKAKQQAMKDISKYCREFGYKNCLPFEYSLTKYFKENENKKI